MNLRNANVVVLIAIFLLFFLVPAHAASHIASSTEAIGISITVPSSGGGGDGGGGGGGGSSPKGPATVSFSGYAYPNASLLFLRNGSVVGTGTADSDGKFGKSIKTDYGLAKFVVEAKDSRNLSSSPTNITIYLDGDSKTEISNILISPTIASNISAIQRSGTPVRIYGTAFKNGIVRIFNSGLGVAVDTVKSGADGKWSYILQTGTWNQGRYSFKVSGDMEDLGLASGFSKEVEIYVGTPPPAPKGVDINGDRKIDIVDLSIMLFHFHKSVTASNQAADLNHDNRIDIRDVSILMYSWTG